MQETMQQTAKTSTRAIIRQYLMDQLVSFTERVPDDALLENYDLDSEQIVALVVFLEGQFQIQIGDDEITIDNLGTLNALVAFVDRKTR